MTRFFGRKLRQKNADDPNVNAHFVFFGQFLAHDFSNTLVRSIGK